MVQKVWENRNDSGTNVRYLVFTKEAADSSTFEASMVYGLLSGTADSNGVVVDPAVEATNGYEIGFIIIDFTTINGFSVGIQNISYLKQVLFTGSVTTLGEGIFQDSGVTTLNVSVGITTISSTVFGGSSVSNITVDGDNVNFSTENGYLYTKDYTKLLLCPPGNSRPIVRVHKSIDDNTATTTIGAEAFIYNTTITTLYLSDVTTIETRAFKNTTALKKVYGIRSLTVGTDAFDISAAEAVVTIANGVTNRVAVSSSATITYDPASPKTATSIDQTYDVTATVTMISDNTLVATKIFSETVFAASNSAPRFTSTVVTTATEDSVYTYTAVATDDDGDTVTLTGTTIPGWLIFTSSTGVLTGTPTNDNVGSHNVVLTASDGSLSTTQEFTITVANVNDGPVFDPITGTTTATEDSAFSYTVAAASDVDSGDSLTYTKHSGPDWVSVSSSGILTGTPSNANVGTGNTVVIRATDGSGAYAEFTLTITVANTNDAPTFTSTPVKTAKTGLLYTYEVKTSDDDRDSVTVTATTIPSWLEFDANTNVLSQTPSNSDVGTHSVVLTATDTKGATATQAFTISVSQFKPADKDELQTAIDKWYDLANDGSATAVTTANNYDGSEYFGNPNTWDTSLITDLSFLFFKKDQENHPDIGTWNVSKVTNMQGTFSNSRFNGELKDWNVASVKDFSYTFANNVVFNQPLERWNVQDATTMEYMFDNAYSFNKNIEPPMMQWKKDSEQYKVSADFPTQLTWDETTINGYLETIYGSATPQTNPTTFKGVFGMIALLKKTYLDNIPDDPDDPDVVGKYNTIKVSFSEVISELITNQQEILKYNYIYDETDGWTKTSPSIYFANTNNKSDGDSNDAKDKLNQLRLNTIVDGMLLINKAYDIAKSLGETDYSDLIEKMKSIYDNVYAGLPFYVAWYAPLLTTKYNFLNNALTFHNGATNGTIDEKLTQFINKNPIKTINGKNYSSTDKQTIVDFSSADLFDKFKTAYNSQSE